MPTATPNNAATCKFCRAKEVCDTREKSLYNTKGMSTDTMWCHHLDQEGRHIVLHGLPTASHRRCHGVMFMKIGWKGKSIECGAMRTAGKGHDRCHAGICPFMRDGKACPVMAGAPKTVPNPKAAAPTTIPALGTARSIVEGTPTPTQVPASLMGDGRTATATKEDVRASAATVTKGGGHTASTKVTKGGGHAATTTVTKGDGRAAAATVIKGDGHAVTGTVTKGDGVALTGTVPKGDGHAATCTAPKGDEHAATGSTCSTTAGHYACDGGALAIKLAKHRLLCVKFGRVASDTAPRGTMM